MRLRGMGPAPPAKPTSQLARPVNELIQIAMGARATREFVVKVQNHRDVRLEAWAAVVSEAQTGRPLRVIGRDTARDLTDDVMSHGIAPGAVFEIGTYLPEADVSGGLKVHLEFAMWQDLHWRGFEIQQKRVLANRERSAEECAFFIGPLRAAAGLAVPQALELLRVTQLDFRQSTLGRQSSGLQAQLAEWELLAKSAPQSLPSQLNAHADNLERSRVALLRHFR